MSVEILIDLGEAVLSGRRVDPDGTSRLAGGPLIPASTLPLTLPSREALASP